MASINELGEFIEGIHPPEMRLELPEVLSHIPYISLKGDRAGAAGVRCIDGYFRMPDGSIERQIREYDVREDNKAVETARGEGLVKPIMLEILLGKPEVCNLRRI